MSVAPPFSTPDDAIGLIEREVLSAEQERRAISRQMLSSLVQSSTGMPLADAVKLVDTYCEEKAPGVPYYLQEEFAIPYMKVVAVCLAIASFAVFWYAMVLYRAGKPNHFELVAGVIVFGMGVFTWVRSLELWAARKNKTA